jgi:hypothetical protein
MIGSPYLVAARIAGVVLVLLLAAGAGAAVNGWRLKSNHSEDKLEMVKRIGDLTLAIEKQNSAVEQMRTAADAANTARQRAEAEAIAQRQAAKKRDDWISKLQGSCSDNMKEAWGRL